MGPGWRDGREGTQELERRAGEGRGGCDGETGAGHKRHTGSPVPRPLLSYRPSVWALQRRGSSCPHSHPHPSYGAEGSAEAVGDLASSWVSPSAGEKLWQRPVYRGLLVPGRATGRRTRVTFSSHLPAKAQPSSYWGLGSQASTRQGAGGHLLTQVQMESEHFFSPFLLIQELFIASWWWAEMVFPKSCLVCRRPSDRTCSALEDRGSGSARGVLSFPLQDL